LEIFLFRDLRLLSINETSEKRLSEEERLERKRRMKWQKGRTKGAL
jgi:hypothetical protein